MAEANVEAKKDYKAGMPYKDIAIKYGVSINTVKSWKQRYAWERFKKKVCKKKYAAKPRITDDKIEEVKAMLSVGNSKREIARVVGISPNSVCNIATGNKDELEQYRTEKKQEFITGAWATINNALECGNQKIVLASKSAAALNENIEKLIEALEDSETDARVIADVTKTLAKSMDIPLRDIASYIGTVYDKVALASGQSTKNINANITTDAPKGISEMSTEELMSQLELLENEQ